jgi:hypothetical protein
MMKKRVLRTNVIRSSVQCVNTFKLAEGCWVYQEKDGQASTYIDGTSPDRLTPNS